jgi:hypothetical protein
MLDERTTQAFIEGFYGYGNWSARVWFVGMEEGGGGSVAEIARRIDAWWTRGRNELEDLATYHEAIGVTRHIGDHAALQPTWTKIIHVLFGMTGKDASSDLVRKYQARELGRIGGETCLIELLPLPSPNVRRWIYGQCTTIPYLANRVSYRERVEPSRVRSIQERIAEHRPRAVVFLGLRYLSAWSEIAGSPLQREPTSGIAYTISGTTLFVAAKHPAARGVTNDYFRCVGEFVQQRASAA